MQNKFTHLTAEGEATMVDISGKDSSKRKAIATGKIKMKPATLQQIVAGKIEKGAVLQTAKLAGIMAAKKTSELIPLCHQILLSKIDIKFEIIQPDEIKISCLVKTDYSTGVEMEALQGVSSAALTIYDMCKAIDKTMEIGELLLKEKEGGSSGTIKRDSLTDYRGQVVAVSLSQEKGTVKKPLPEIELIEERGVKNDAHAGKGHRQVSLLAEESMAKMISQLDDKTFIGYGDFAENITTRGINLHTLPVGSKIYLGSEVVLEVTQIGKECHDGCAIAQTVGECIMPKEGIFARVLQGGRVKTGMKILLEGVKNESSGTDH